MSPETIAVASVGIALAGLIVGFWRDVRGEMKALTKRVDDLTERVNNVSERVSRIEGLIEGLIGRRSSGPKP
ncbi:MAG: hypothetical protein OXI70_13310 [Chloroflexota bacterium]|nr:hypothetical protein [Chloroflexota bacterium]MDE2868981.1 hypothetical protein [Chloroflexota bacterium]